MRFFCMFYFPRYFLRYILGYSGSGHFSFFQRQTLAQFEENIFAFNLKLDGDIM